MLIHTNQPLITSFYIKKVPIFAELAMSLFCASDRAREGYVLGAQSL